uniref:Uncharacterized protein n=1 Tax=Anguilla anguilla TaxID=7936 RepID=A0A0E9W4G4_ANGAN
MCAECGGTVPVLSVEVLYLCCMRRVLYLCRVWGVLCRC